MTLGYGAMVREAREAQGWSQVELAEALGPTLKLKHHDISRIENEKKLITPALFEGLLAALPTLRRLRLLEAMGYPPALPERDKAVPERLAKLIGQLDDEQLAVLQRQARGLLLEAEDRRRAS